MLCDMMHLISFFARYCKLYYAPLSAVPVRVLPRPISTTALLHSFSETCALCRMCVDRLTCYFFSAMYTCCFLLPYSLQTWAK